MEELYLSRNQVSDISPLQGLVNLEELDLIDNEVSDLSPLQALVNLKELDLSYNQVSDLSSLQAIANLNSLHLRGNQVSDISPLQALVNLKELDLRFNEVKKIENWITGYDMDVIINENYRGNALNLYGNPIENVPVEIIKQGKQAIIDYFGRIEKEGETEYLYESKLLIIGEGGVGKTSFAIKLKDADAELPEPEDSTVNIDIGKWEFLFSDKIHGNIERTFYVNLWDFGGQKIYRGTHQIFFCNKTCYILVEDTRESKTDFAYWLNSAEQFAGEKSSLLIILNKKQGYPVVLDRTGLKKRFITLIKDIIDVDLKGDRKGIIRMQEQVKQLLLHLPDIGDELPASWVKIRKDLLDEKERSISFDRFRKICKNYKITGSSEIKTLSSYLNRIGVFTHFMDDPILRNKVYLDSNWLVKTIYKVIDDELIKEKKGKIKGEDINKIWDDDVLQMESDVLVQIMHNFGLMYHVQNSDEYVIPAHLQDNMPYLEWDYNNKAGILVFIYEFDKYMPDGLFPKIIVTLHKYIKNQEYVWRRGINLEYNRTYAEIIETYEAVDRYKIRLWGVNKEGLLAIIREKISEELEPYRKLNYKELIPCNCEICNTLEMPNFYEYSELIERINAGKSTVDCRNKKFKEVRIDELLKIIVPIEKNIKKAEGDKKEFKIFLASSNELKEERDEIDKLINRLNKKYHDQGIFLNLVMWEDKSKGFYREKYQDYLNKEIPQSDIFLSLFFSKVGKYTKEEYDLAYERFNDNKKPAHFFVYFKQADISIDEVTEEMLEIKKMKDYIRSQDQYYAKYVSIPELLFYIWVELEGIISGKDY